MTAVHTMFGKRFHLFTAFGFPVEVDASWFVIAALLTWSLASGLFPALVEGLPATTAWLLGVVGTVGLFGSVVVHELAHALTARRYGLRIRGITLFIFGGVARMDSQPPHPRAEFMVAVAGPVLSAILAALFLGAALPAGGLAAAGALISYLAWANGLLALFNLVPAFPLDGGRMLRALLWQWKGSLRGATRITSTIGSGFGWLLIGWGVVSAFRGGDLIGSLWYVLIGLFLRNAARSSYRGLVIRRALEGEPVSRFMAAEPVVVSRALSIAELVDEYILRYQHKMFPVVENGRLLGMVTSHAVQELPQEEWPRQSVASVLEPSGPENCVSPQTDAMQALDQMNRTGHSRLLVADGERLAGVLALKDLLRFLSLKVDLGRGRRGARS